MAVSVDAGFETIRCRNISSMWGRVLKVVHCFSVPVLSCFLWGYIATDFCRTKIAAVLLWVLLPHRSSFHKSGRKRILKTFSRACEKHRICKKVGWSLLSHRMCKANCNESHAKDVFAWKRSLDGFPCIIFFLHSSIHIAVRTTHCVLTFVKLISWVSSKQLYFVFPL